MKIFKSLQVSIDFSTKPLIVPLTPNPLEMHISKIF